MFIYYVIVFFIFGTVLGSFYNVVGYRLPKGQSLVKPDSHCTSCNHKLGPKELVPIFSYVFLGGKCLNCKSKISLFYPLFELLSGILFSLSYVMFGFTLNCFISLVFISMLLIIIISDYQTMIIPDSVLLISSILLIILNIIGFGWKHTLISGLNGIGSFTLMLIIKLLGDFIFKRDSMGGGDIKLMGIFGFVLGFPLSVILIFVSSLIALPISLILINKNPSHEIPFGPFLAISAILIFFSQLDISTILQIWLK